MALTTEFAEQFDPRASPWVTDPTGWVEARLNEHLWSKERDIMESVRDHRRTAVHSCFNVGKSFTAARVAAWWIETNPAFDAFVVSTAPTFPQVRVILWREIGRAHRRGKLRGRVNQTEWWLGAEQVAMGRKPSDYDEAAFQGIHQRRVLVVLDEAAGVAKMIWDAVEGLVSNEESRVLAIGNPIDSMSHFAEVCKPGSGWNVIHIDAFDSPNFTDEPVPDRLRPLLISPVWVEDRKRDWGEESALYVSKVRGQFPEDAEDGVVRASKVAKCRIPQDGAPTTPVELGVDVGAGGDMTVIRERRGRKAGRVWRDHSNDGEQIIGKIVAAIRQTGATKVKVDSIGIGFGITEWLRSKRAEHGAQVIGVNVGESSTDKERFALLRDQLWWQIGRELSEDEAWDLSGVDDDTIAQLLAPKYKLDVHGRIKVERKDETRDRLGRSPDDADALLLCYFEAVGGETGSSTADMRPVPRRRPDRDRGATRDRVLRRR